MTNTNHRLQTDWAEQLFDFARKMKFSKPETEPPGYYHGRLQRFFESYPGGDKPADIDDARLEFDRAYERVKYPPPRNRTGPQVSTDEDDAGYDPHGDDDDKPDTPPALTPISFGELQAQYPRLREPVVHGLLRAGEVMNVVSSSKIGKSWLSYSLALAICAGQDWLDSFQTEPGRVLLIDNELHPETIAHRIPVVGDALGIPPADYADALDVISLRGRLTNIIGLEPTVTAIGADKYRLIICDSLYRMLPDGVSENSNADITKVYNWLDRYAAITGAALVLIHHTSKGNQGEKSVTDTGAGAGAQSRAADSHLILRPHEEDNHVGMDAVVRSWPPVDAMALQWSFPLWVPNRQLDATKLKGRLNGQDLRQKEKDAAGMDAICAALKSGPATARDLRGRTGFGNQRLDRLLPMLEAQGRITQEPAIVGHNQTVRYALSK